MRVSVWALAVLVAVAVACVGGLLVGGRAQGEEGPLRTLDGSEEVMKWARRPHPAIPIIVL